MLKLPLNGRWTQPNTSDKFGSILASKNLNLSEEGYAKLSPRSVKLIDEVASSNFGVPHGIGKFADGEFQVGTTSNANFTALISKRALTLTEDTGTGNPLMTTDSSGRFFQGRWWVTSTDSILSKAANDDASSTWDTSSGETGLTTGVKHFLDVFASRRTLTVTNGNVVKQYTASNGDLVNTTNLTIPSDFEIVKTAYNNSKMGVCTRMATVGVTDIPVQEAKFYLWDGASTSATGYGVGSDTCMDIVPYKSTFAILTRSGELKEFNGGGFKTLATLPFYNRDYVWSEVDTNYPTGDSMSVDGDVIYLNIGLRLNTFGRIEERRIPECPSGVWCYDPRVGLYHRFSPSVSQLYVSTVASGDTNTTTDVLTTSGTIPATGNIARYTSIESGSPIGGLTVGQDYYIIKLSSTAFSLATSKENALNNIKINLTSQASDTSYFHMYEIVDFANTYHENTGAVSLLGENTTVYRDLIFGGDYASLTDATNDNETLCIVVPFLENRGWFVTPKAFSAGVTDTNQTVIVKYRPLKDTDSIIVKVKRKSLVGLPVSSPESKEANWTSPSEFYTTTDLSKAKTALDAGNELEIELVSGAGAGQMLKVESISSPSSGTTSVVLAEEPIGTASGRDSHFIIDNWEKLGEITSDDTDGYKSFTISKKSKFIQFKIELRGSDTTIEELQLNQITTKAE